MRITISIVNPDVIAHIEKLQKNNQNVSGFFTVAALDAIHNQQNNPSKSKDEIRDMVEHILQENGYLIQDAIAEDGEVNTNDDSIQKEETPSDDNQNQKIKDLMNAMFSNIENDT